MVAPGPPGLLAVKAFARSPSGRRIGPWARERSSCWLQPPRRPPLRRPPHRRSCW